MTTTKKMSRRKHFLFTFTQGPHLLVLLCHSIYSSVKYQCDAKGTKTERLVGKSKIYNISPS